MCVYYVKVSLNNHLGSISNFSFSHIYPAKDRESRQSQTSSRRDCMQAWEPAVCRGLQDEPGVLDFLRTKKPIVKCAEKAVMQAFASTTNGLWDGNLIRKSICACTTPRIFSSAAKSRTRFCRFIVSAESRTRKSSSQSALF